MPSLLPKFLSGRLVFRFGNRQKSEGAKSRGYGDEERPWICIKSQQPEQLERSGLVHYLARAQHLELTFHFFYLQGLLHNIHHLSFDLPQDLTMITPWLSQKIEAITFPAEETLFFLRRVSQHASIAYSDFWPQDQSDGPVSPWVTTWRISSSGSS